MAWRASVGAGFSSVVVSQGRAFTMGNAGGVDTVFCFDARSGQVRWKHSYKAPLDAKYYEGGPSATPTVDGDRVFTLSKRGKLFSLEAATGQVVWEKDLAGELLAPVNEWGFASSPLVEGNLLFLNVGAAGTAVEKATGKVAWYSEQKTAGYASAMPLDLDGRRVLVLFTAKFLHGLVPATGKELWRHSWETGWDNNNADPIVDGGRIFISSYSRGCALLEVRDGRLHEVYQNENLHSHMSTAVKIGSHLYGFNGREGRGRPNDFRCLDFLTGEVKWKHEGLGVGALSTADGKLLILSETGELVLAEARPDKFNPLSRTQVLGGRCWTMPVLANGHLYCRNAKGDLVCLDVQGRK